MPFEHKRIQIGHVAAEFYTLEALKLMCSNNFEDFKQSHERFKSDLLDYKNRFESLVAIMLRDYITLASAGEARWSRSKCKEKFLGNYPHGGSRDGVVPYVVMCNPKSISKVLVELYGYGWRDGFGGTKWKRIAKAISFYGVLDNTAFIDHCIDLSHNGGSCFDKHQFKIFQLSGNYTCFLDRKTHAKDPHDLLRAVTEYGYQCGISTNTFNLINRAESLGFISEGWYNKFTERLNYYSSDSLYEVGTIFNDYIPVQWGDEIFSPEMKDRQAYDMSGYALNTCDNSYDCSTCGDAECGNHPSNNPVNDFDCDADDDCDDYNDGDDDCDGESSGEVFEGCYGINGMCNICNIESCPSHSVNKGKGKKPNEGVIVNVRKVV